MKTIETQRRQQGDHEWDSARLVAMEPRKHGNNIMRNAVRSAEDIQFSLFYLSLTTFCAQRHAASSQSPSIRVQYSPAFSSRQSKNLSLANCVYNEMQLH